MTLERALFDLPPNLPPQDGCPLFAPACAGRQRRAEAPSTASLFLSSSLLSSPTGVVMSLWPAQGDEKRLGPATALYGTVALPFVIPSEAGGSAVPQTSLGNVQHYPQTKLSSRPERTRISCHAAPDRAARAPFSKGKAHELHQRHQVRQEFRGNAVERSAVFRKPSWVPLVLSGFVSGHDFSRAVKAANDEGFSPCGSSVRVRKVN
jgi:hypothetical protein